MEEVNVFVVEVPVDAKAVVWLGEVDVLVVAIPVGTVCGFVVAVLVGS